MGELAAILEGIVIRDSDDLIVDLRVERLRHEASADALDLVRASLTLREDRARLRLDCDDVDALVLLLEVVADAGERAARAYASDEGIDFAVEVVVDLRARRRLMGSRVGRVGELLRNEGVRRLLGEFFCLGDRALHALRAVRQDNLRAVCLEQIAALDAHRLRHRQDGLITAGCCDTGEADTRVAGSRLDDRCARLELTILLSLLDHGLGDAVLDGASRVKVLELHVDVGLETIGLDEVVGL